MSRPSLSFSLVLPGLALGCAAPALAAPVAHAPGVATKATTETISVVSRSRNARRAERIQHTAASVSLLSAARLEARAIVSTRQLANLTPNLYQPRATVGYSNANYFIRGIGELDPQGEPSVGTYIDGVYLPRTIGTMQELLDIDAIEIDRGPVGFTTGHQAEGGAVRIDTMLPDDRRRLIAQAGYGTFNEWSTGVVVSGPLVRDRVYASLAVSHHASDGFDRNVTLDRRVNDIDYTQARGKLRFTPTEDLDIVLAFDGTADGSTNRGYGSLLAADRYALASSIYPKNNYSEAGFTGTVTNHFGAHWTLRSISAVRGYDDRGAYDNTGDLYARTSQLLYYRDRSYSQELRATGQWDRLTFVGGVYGFYEDWLTQRWANNVSRYTVDPRQTVYMPVYANIDQINRNAAIFGQARYRLTQRLTATVGLRWNFENHGNAETLSYLASTPTHTVAWPAALGVLYNASPAAVAWRANAHGSWEQLLPKGSLEYQITPRVLGYATISQGGKSAGYDYRAQTPTASGRQQALLPYAPETVTTYELGAKSEPLAGRLTLNGALFYNSFDALQITTLDPSTGLSHRYNAGDGHSYGAEFEAHWHPVAAVSIDATGSYLFAQLDSFAGVFSRTVYASGLAINNTPRAGERLPYAPRFQGNLAASYTLPRRWTRNLPGEFRIGGDVSYQSALFTDALDNTQTRLPDQTYFNALLAWTSADRHWDVSLSARNLADRRLPQTLSFVQAQGVPLIWAASYANPRTVFATLRYRL